MQKTKPLLVLVSPCYNEETALARSARSFSDKLGALVASGAIASDSRILFADDGSHDGTWNLICELANQDPRVTGISLSHNRGQQAAILAGLMEVRGKCDIAITLDCDGQDDINAIDDMLGKWADGNDIVYGVRNDRTDDTWFKRNSAQWFYRLMAMLGVDIVYNHADFRLVSARAIDALAEFHETNLFLRGMFPYLGFRHASVEYRRLVRTEGDSHYPLAKMLAFAFDGITSFSIRPIRCITWLALAFVVGGIGGIACAFNATPFWIMLFSGIQLAAIGLVGEYVGKTYMETKKRPRFTIAARTPNP